MIFPILPLHEKKVIAVTKVQNSEMTATAW